MDAPVLQIDSLHVKTDQKEIIKGVDLCIKSGEVHIIFGPNGSGKSTLLSAIMHLPGYTITSGSVSIHGNDTSVMTTDEIANLGVGISFQHPPKIKGVALGAFLHAIDHSKALQKEVAALHLENFLERELNVGFSGGELKRAEILKLYAQNPQLLLIDEPESGVDIENIAVISKAVNALLKERTHTGKARSALIITHTGHILNYIDANAGYVFMDGRIVCMGEPAKILDDIKARGFSGCVNCPKALKEKR